MASISRDLKELRIRTTSTDGMTIVELDRHSGMRVSIKSAHGRPPRAIADSVADGLTKALTAYGTARDKIFAAVTNTNPRAAFTPNPTQKRFSAVVNTLVTEAKSPRGKVRIRWVGQCDVTIHIDQSTVIAHDALTYEINAAIKSAEGLRGRQLWRIHEKLYRQNEKA